MKTGLDFQILRADNMGSILPIGKAEKMSSVFEECSQKFISKPAQNPMKTGWRPLHLPMAASTVPIEE